MTYIFILGLDSRAVLSPKLGGTHLPRHRSSRQAERVLRFSAGYDGIVLNTGVDHLRDAVVQRGWEFKLADFLLASRGHYAVPNVVKEMLEEAGSIYTVDVRAGKPGLVKRIETGVRIAAEETMDRFGRAGERLAEAWTAVFGLAPDPSRAY